MPAEDAAFSYLSQQKNEATAVIDLFAPFPLYVREAYEAVHEAIILLQDYAEGRESPFSSDVLNLFPGQELQNIDFELLVDGGERASYFFVDEEDDPSVRYYDEVFYTPMLQRVAEKASQDGVIVEVTELKQKLVEFSTSLTTTMAENMAAEMSPEDLTTLQELKNRLERTDFSDKEE